LCFGGWLQGLWWRLRTLCERLGTVLWAWVPTTWPPCTPSCEPWTPCTLGMYQHRSRVACQPVSSVATGGEHAHLCLTSACCTLGVADTTRTWRRLQGQPVPEGEWEPAPGQHPSPSACACACAMLTMPLPAHAGGMPSAFSNKRGTLLVAHAQPFSPRRSKHKPAPHSPDHNSPGHTHTHTPAHPPHITSSTRAAGATRPGHRWPPCAEPPESQRTGAPRSSP
jgi:hypothetical protein